MFYGGEMCSLPRDTSTKCFFDYLSLEWIFFPGGSNTVINISPNPSSIYSPLSQAHFLTWKEHSVIFLKWINECNNETDDTPTSTLTTWNWHPASESRTCGSCTHGLSQSRVHTWVTSGSFWKPHGWTTWVSMAVVSRWPWSSLWGQHKCPNMSTQRAQGQSQIIGSSFMRKAGCRGTYVIFWISRRESWEVWYTLRDSSGLLFYGCFQHYNY